MNTRHLAMYFHDQSKRIQSCARQVVDKGNRSAVHDLRVAVRRSRSVLNLLKPKANGLDHQLRRLAKALGAVRELDIADRDAKAYGLKTKKLKRQRKKRIEKAKRHIEISQKKFGKNLVQTEDRLAKAPLFLDKRVEKLTDQLSHWQQHVPKKADALHQFRKTVKKSRYTLEALGKNAQPLEKLQDILGRAHDLEVLESLKGRQPAVHADLRRYRRDARRLAPPAIAYAIKHLAILGHSNEN